MSTKALPGADGNDAQRAELERTAATAILAGLRAQLAAAVPDDVDEQTIAGADQRTLEASGALRDALNDALVTAMLAGVDMGRRQTDYLMGVASKAAPALPRAAGELADVPGITVDWTLVNAEARDWARQYAGELVRGINDTTATVLRQAVAEWIGNGLTREQVIAQIGDAFGEKRATRIAVTEVTRAYAEGNRLAWRRSGIIAQMEWRTSKDERVCPACGPLHGITTPVEQGFSAGPPAHPSCRCWTVPVVER